MKGYSQCDAPPPSYAQDIPITVEQPRQERNGATISRSVTPDASGSDRPRVIQEEIHFNISDSLGALPATFTSPLTTNAGVMNTP